MENRLPIQMDKRPMMADTWNPSLTPLVLVRKTFETQDTANFFFATPQHHTFTFKPGQFVTVKADIEGQTYARSYSISSLPEKAELQLTIKRVTGGVVSNWLIDHLLPGDSLCTYGFAGDFNIVDCLPKDKVLMISAGCGITPVMAMTRHLLNGAAQPVAKVDFLHCAKDIENVIYLDDMRHMAKTHSRFQAHLLLEQIGGQSGSERTYEGLISLAHLQACCPDYLVRSVYLCGPAKFMEVVEGIFRDSGFDMACFFKESFLPSNSCDATVAADAAQCAVNVPDFQVSQQVDAGSVLLDVLEQAHVPVIGACRSGVCGSCKCKVTRGKVASSSHATLTEQEQADGYVLACSSKVVEDVDVALK